MAWPCRLVIDVSSSSILLPPSRSAASLAFYLLGAGCVVCSAVTLKLQICCWDELFPFCTVLRSCLWRCGKVVCNSTLLAVATAQNYFNNNYEYFSKTKVWSFKQSHAVHVKATDDLMKTMAASMSPGSSLVTHRPRTGGSERHLPGNNSHLPHQTVVWCGADKLFPPPTVYNCLTWICQGKKTLENAARSHVTLHLTNRVDLYEIPGKMMLKMTRISKYIVIPVVSLPKNSLVVLKSDKPW